MKQADGSPARWRAQVGAKGSGTSKDVAGKMMKGPAGEEHKAVEDADNSQEKVGEELAKLHKGRGAKSVRCLSALRSGPNKKNRNVISARCMGT